MSEKEMFNRYELVLNFTGQLMGGIPKHKDVIANWLEARQPSEAAFAKMKAATGLPDGIDVNITPIPELTEQVIYDMGAVDEKEAKVWCGFKKDETSLFLDGYHVKSHLKDNANILQKFMDAKALKSKLADRLFVLQPKLYLGVMEPTGYWEHPVHIMTMQGPRSALKRNDYIETPSLSCTLQVLNDGLITGKIIDTILQFGSVKGFGAERGLGHGRYTYKLTEVI